MKCKQAKRYSYNWQNPKQLLTAGSQKVNLLFQQYMILNSTIII